MNKKVLSMLIVITAGTVLLSSPVAPAYAGKDIRPTKAAKIKGKFANIIGGQVTVLAGPTLTVTKDSKTYTVNTFTNTRFRRHFWGKSSISEISVGDNVNVWGKWADDSETSINAVMVRDTSIQKRNGVFVGTVK